jgi:hypothetical protein
MKNILYLALTAFAFVNAAPLSTRDVITVQNDITQKIGPSVTTLNTAINTFPEGGVTVDVRSIHRSRP